MIEIMGMEYLLRFSLRTLQSYSSSFGTCRFSVFSRWRNNYADLNAKPTVIIKVI